MSRAERVEAAAFQLCMAERINWEDIDKAQKYTFRADASAALTASDALLRTDEAVERVARELYAADGKRPAGWAPMFKPVVDVQRYRDLAKTAIAALLGEGE